MDLRRALLALSCLAPALALPQGVKAPGAATVTMSLPLNANGPVMSDDAGTVAHWIAQPRNMLSQSQALATSPWTNSNTAVVNNATTAPDGTTTGTTVTKTNTTQNAAVAQTSITVVNATAYTLSFWVKATATSNQMDFGTYYGYWPANSAIILSGPGTIGASGMSNLPRVTGLSQTTWTRIAYTATTTVTNLNVYFYPDGVYSTTTGAGVAIWGVQYELGSQATNYIPTTTTPSLGGIDTRGNAWTQNGTVPAVLGPGPFVPGRVGVGPFSDANYFSLGSGADVLDFSGDFSACFAFFGGPSASGPGIFTDGVYNSAGWGVVLTVSGAVNFWTASSAYDLITASTVVPGPNIACVGRAGSTKYAKLNVGTTASIAAGSMAVGSSGAAMLGRYPVQPYTAPIYEAWFSSTPWNEASVTKIQQRVLGMLGTRGEPISVTRSTTATYSGADGAIYTAAPGVLRVTSSGALIEPAATNVVLQSQALATTWGANNVTATNNTTAAPDGTTTGTTVAKSNTTTSASANQAVATSVGVPYTFSIWLRAGTSSQASFGLISSGWPAWTATISGPGALSASSGAVGTFPAVTGLSASQWTRVSVTGTTATSPSTVYVYPDGYLSTTTGASIIAWGAQVESGSVATSYIPTTSTSASRSADQVSVSTPATMPPASWSLAATVAPSSWAAGPCYAALGAMTRDGAGVPNTVKLVYNGRHTFQVFDGAGASLASQSAPTGWAAGTAHRLVFSSTLLAISGDGVNLGGPPSGSGVGLQSRPATLWIGQCASGDHALGGFLSDFRVCRRGTLGGDCR